MSLTRSRRGGITAAASRLAEPGSTNDASTAVSSTCTTAPSPETTRWKLLRSLDDPNYVMVDLEVDTAEHAEELRRALQELWHRVQAQSLIGEQQARVADIVEVREY